MVEHAVWLEKLHDAVSEMGEEGRAAVEFLRSRGTKVGFKKVRPNVGAFWTMFGNIRLNSQYYNYDTPFDDLLQYGRHGSLLCRQVPMAVLV